jgi:Do/DeqQ family serine protease
MIRRACWLQSAMNKHVRNLKAPIALGLALMAPLAAQASPPAESPIATAQQLGVAFSNIAERVSPSVVSIQVEVRNNQPAPGFFGFPFGRQQLDPGIQKGSGSGMILTADGAILTNNHVVEHASRIQVTLQDGRHFTGKVAGVDPATDLAVVKIDAKGLPAVKFADSESARVGEWVVAIGSPFGVLDYTVTAGVLSAKGRGSLGANEIEDYLQTDASINPGNSGGPLVNLNGDVLGVNTMIIGSSGIGFAIPSNLARKVGMELLQKGDVSRAYIGVNYQELTPELASSFGVQRTRGALVNEVVPNGPAAKAGLRSGDIVLDVNGREVKEGKDLQRAILLFPVGEKLTVTVLRDGQQQKLSVVTAERPDHREAKNGLGGPKRGNRAAPAASGVELAPVTPEIARRIDYAGPGGVVVADVAPGSSADRAGLQRGDVIEEVNRKPAKDEKQVQDAISGGRALLKLSRGGNTMFTAISE